MNSRLLIVIATYNEIENLPKLVDQLVGLLPSAEILVIDDNSPDGTADWCRETAEANENFHVIVRESKLGLGSAAVRGFEFGLQGDYDLIATMDDDFSHAPESLLEMVQAMDDPEGAAENEIGVMLGSRYVPGGGVEGWPLYRRFTSRAVNGLARWMLRLKTYDNSGAFRVYRRSALQTIDVSKIQSSGYAYLEEIIWRLNHSNVKLAEHPITFRDRTEGRSKANFLVGLSVLKQLVRFAFSKP